MASAADLSKTLSEKGVRYVFGYYVDIHGVPKSKCVPVSSLESMAAGSELYTVGALEGMGELGPHEDECQGFPDLDRLVVLPWDRQVALAPSTLKLDNDLYPQDSRNVLLQQVERAAEMGYVANVGIEPEFYVVRPTETGWEPIVPSDQLNQPTRGYDLEATILAKDFLDPMAQYMAELDWGLYSFDHEGGDGQYEFNFNYADALTMADRMVLFRLMAKHCARTLGCIATFMPKPFQDDFGSAAHINISLADTVSGRNVFAATEGAGYSDVSRHFTAGVLAHGDAITAVTCPTVNSYKRFTSKGFMDEISWAPIYRAWGNNNRTLMCRLPVNRHCLEVRTADAAVNYYLGIAMVLAAGLDGIEKKLDPGEPLNVDTYKLDPAELRDMALPTTFERSLASFDSDDLAQRTFGKDFHRTYFEYMSNECREYQSVVTDWETRAYLQRI